MPTAKTQNHQRHCHSWEDISAFSSHVWITLISWVIGVAIGAGIGYLVARLLRSLTRANAGLRRALAFAPGRTLVFLVLLFLWSPFLATRLGIGTTTGIVIVSSTIALLAGSMMVNGLLDRRYPPGFARWLVAWLRTLLIIALFATLGAGLVGGGGAGFLIVQQVNLLDYQGLRQSLYLLGAIALLLDLVLGLVEYWVSA